MLLLLLLYIFSSAKSQPSVTCPMASPKDLAPEDHGHEDHARRDHQAEDLLEAIQNLLLASKRVSDPRECTIITVGYVGTQTK